jgi:phthiocerol/phenolphthiocerol synthesis type-I polyketide synthase D
VDAARDRQDTSVLIEGSCDFIQEDIVASTTDKSDRGISFGLIFFASSEAPFSGENKYRLVIESTKFADRHGFSGVWIPERHFTRDGWLYPNPVVLLAALARETSQIRLRAGSVVLPLHDPIRVAEEWAMVDNLSGGRVEISFASGWHPNDFVFFPERYANRQEEMYRGMEEVLKFWRGETIQRKGGDGKMVEIRTYPAPLQADLPIWVTAAGNPKTFAGAGEQGANLLTHMYNQSLEELAEKIAIYREARAKHGYDPQSGQVSVMLHTYIGESAEAVRAHTEEPFCEYLKSASYLFNAIAYSRGQKVDLSSLSEQDFNDYLHFVYDRLVSTERVLFGTPESGLDLVKRIKAAGVNEIACQLDYGLDIDIVLASMEHLNRLKELCDAEFVQQPAEPSALDLPRDEGVTLNTLPNGNGPLAHEDGLVPEQSRGAATLLYSREANRLEDIQERCQKEIPVPIFYGMLHERGIQLNASFQGIERLWRRDGEALGQIQLLETLEPEAGFYQVHPTLLDACFQVLVAALLDEALAENTGTLYLPTGLRSFQLHRRPGKCVWSHATLETGTDPLSDMVEGNVRILDEDGLVVAEASGLQLRRSEPTARPTPLEELSDWLYELRWEAKDLDGAASRTMQPGRWLIFMDSKGVGQKVADLLTQCGESCIRVVPGEAYQVSARGQYYVNPESANDMRRLMEDVAHSDNVPLRGVLHLWSLDATPTTKASPASLEADQVAGVGSALNVIQSLATGAASEPARIWLITRGAQPVSAEDSALAVAQAPLWGLGKTCAMEHPELWGGLVDLDAQSSAQEAAEQLLAAFYNEQGEDQIAFRQGQSYVARLVRSRDWQPRELALRSDASYLITGGLWGLGLEVARWLAKKGVQHLVLLGRTRLPERAHWNQAPADSRESRQIAGIRSLEELGAHVYYAAVDVADEGQLAAFLEDFARQGRPPIRGVIHTASVWQDAQGQSLVRPLANLDATALKEVFRPKMLGGWLLHTLLKGSELDFFVSFSSGASLLGSAAQGNYAAAGAFLDALAHYQRAQGQPALSIDWGAVSETGFGATAEGLRVHEYWESHGIQRITPRQVLAALELLIPQQAAQVGVIKLDWRLLQEFYQQISSLPLVSYQVAEVVDRSTPPGATVQEKNAIVRTILGADQGERQHLMESYLCEQAAGVLRLPADRLDVQQPLTALGLDSLMAIELKNRIEHELNVRIPIVTFLQGVSIAQFATQMLDQIITVDSAASTPPLSQDQSEEVRSDAINQGDAEQLLTQLDQLSDDEVDSLLSRMLQEEELD